MRQAIQDAESGYRFNEAKCYIRLKHIISNLAHSSVHLDSNGDYSLNEIYVHYLSFTDFRSAAICIISITDYYFEFMIDHSYSWFDSAINNKHSSIGSEFPEMNDLNINDSDDFYNNILYCKDQWMTATKPLRASLIKRR